MTKIQVDSNGKAIMLGGKALVASEGGVTPTGTLSITENGTYDVTNYASANVSVSGGGLPTTLYCFRSSNLTPRIIWLMSIEDWVVQKGIYPSSGTLIGATTDDFYYDSSNQILVKWDGVQGEVTNYTRYSNLDVTL